VQPAPYNGNRISTLSNARRTTRRSPPRTARRNASRQKAITPAKLNTVSKLDTKIDEIEDKLKGMEYNIMNLINQEISVPPQVVKAFNAMVSLKQTLIEKRDEFLSRTPS